MLHGKFANLVSVSPVGSIVAHFLKGFATLSSLEDGYYGQGEIHSMLCERLTLLGIYFTSSAKYALPYYAHKVKPCIIMCFIIPGTVASFSVNSIDIFRKPIPRN